MRTAAVRRGPRMPGGGRGVRDRCRWVRWILLLTGGVSLGGCHELARQADRDVARLIAERQRGALGLRGQVQICTPAVPRTPKTAYEYGPNPSVPQLPPGYEIPPTASQPAGAPNEAAPPADPPSAGPSPEGLAAVGASAAESERLSPPGSRPSAPGESAAETPLTRSERLLTLTGALAYAQQHQREYMTAKEDLYLSALALTLERHLWTPIFASNLRTVYGNFGEDSGFDQAMRFVADLSVAQRLPYGGQFTASAISTLIRDVKQSITAAEGGVVELGLNIPFLRGAGHVARETLIQLERELTYAVRTFERYRQAQLVDVAQGYFGLLVLKQAVYDAEQSYRNLAADFERARALEERGQANVLDTLRAEQAVVTAEKNVLDAREALRSAADQFKLSIGMPVDEPLGQDDIEDIETIERQIEAGVYPLLMPPAAIDDERGAIQVALSRRLDLKTLADRIDDARRGVAVSKNALLPDLNWTNTLTMDTDPQHYNVAAIGWNRAVWRSEVLLALPLERTKERNDLRRAMIGVRQAQREYLDGEESIRADVRRAVHRVRLADKSVAIEQRNVQVAERRRELARYRFEEMGDLDNRDVVEAEEEVRTASNRLNLAKRSRWTELLQFRLATETLGIDEEGRQAVDFDMPCEE